jgi:hypothetical protein
MACIGVLVSSTTRHYLEREGNFVVVPLGRLPRTSGRMAEWLMALVLKTSRGESPSKVRILLLPLRVGVGRAWLGTSHWREHHAGSNPAHQSYSEAVVPWTAVITYISYPPDVNRASHGTERVALISGRTETAYAGRVEPPSTFGVVAQLVERRVCNANVAGSIPANSTHC